MGSFFRHKLLPFLIPTLLLPLSFHAQGPSRDRILRSYFPGNEARDQAVISARYAEAAHRFAYRLLEPTLLASGEQRKLLSSDTARAFILHARQRVDSTRAYAPDTAEMALKLMKRAERDLEEGAAYLRAYRKAEDKSVRKALAEKALYRTADASVDAFHASMLLGRKRPFKSGGPKLEKENLYDMMGHVKKREEPSYEEKVSRLEADRSNYRRLRERYEKKLRKKKDELEALKKGKATADRIEGLKKRIELLTLRQKDAADQVRTIDGMLQDKLLRHIGVDSSKAEANRFQVDRWGYYDERAVPIDSGQPDGLIYRVQIGYYSKGNRPDKKLKGLYPLWGEKVSDRYIRYCVGRFRGYDQAAKAKTYLREEKGFDGAFIVAYKDGKKIPVVDAIKEGKE